MEEMREIVDIRTVDSAIKIAAIVFPLLCLAIGAGVGAARRSFGAPLIRGATVAILGPLVLIAWVFYSWMTRYDPESGYFGLDKVWVLALNLVLFVGVGCAYGCVASRIWARTAVAPTEAEAQDPEK